MTDGARDAALPDGPLLSVRNLETRFELDEGTVHAVDDVSFDVHPGQVVGIVGESGCGKSATVKSILRIVEPPGRVAAGSILFRRPGAGGETVDLARLAPRGRRIRAIRGAEIALIPQEPMAAFSPVHTIGNQLVEAVRLHRRAGRREAWRIAVERLAEVGVPAPEACMDAYSWELSGGLRQRAMIAMALTCEPSLLIADEPTTAIDVTTQAQVLTLLRTLKQRHDTAFIFITHDLGVIAQLADEVVVMYLGKVMEAGPVDDIFHRPQHPYTRALLASIPTLHTDRRGRLATIQGSIPHPFSRPRGCLFFPRCPDAMPGTCDLRMPGRTAVGDGHAVSCFKHGGARMNAAEASPVTAESRAPLLDVRRLHKYYPIRQGLLKKTVGHVKSVDDVSFHIDEGETLGLVGESGCGKTTTSRCILRAVEPTSGRILFRNAAGEQVDVAALPKQALRPLRREMQMVFQDPFASLNPRMNLLDLVGEPMLVNGMTRRAERTERVAELLRLVGLRPETMRRYPHAFSGGQRQRIVLARALALEPRLIVADEPVSALDVSVQAQVLNLMLELQERLDLTYLFVAHDLGVVKHISDRVAVMYVGKIVETAPTQALFHAPRHPYTAALMSAVPVPDPRIRSQLTPLPGDVPSPANPPSGCYFHPRCAFATERCRVEAPSLDEVASAHHVSCHRAGELDLPGIGGG